MPVRKVKGGYRWGKSGKVYKTKAAAERQWEEQAEIALRRKKEKREKEEAIKLRRIQDYAPFRDT